ncbi:hypothetical protein [Desemzia sp. FAM 23991]|uniref:hypothetical protein n=1 Tax=unclassified Desemzia TaxID=2685243 RepID=UPI0038857B6D
MDKNTIKQLTKRMKKFKTWTEGTFVNPISYRVNGKLYYMTGFTKGGESVGTAYFTLDGEEVKAEAYEAQTYLSTFADISKNIFSIGEDHLKIDLDYYTLPLAIPVDSELSEVIAGHQAYQKLWEWHQEYNQCILEYKDYYEKDVLIREEITVDDVRKTQKTAAIVNLYQYDTLKLLLEKNAEIEAYVAYLETTAEWKKLTKNQRYFVKELTKNKERLKNSLHTLDLIEAENREEMLQLNFDYGVKINVEQMIGQQQYIRYP